MNETLHDDVVAAANRVNSAIQRLDLEGHPYDDVVALYEALVDLRAALNAADELDE